MTENVLENALLVGSHAYGTPHEYSDIDLVVLVPQVTVNRLYAEADPPRGMNLRGYILGGGMPMRFGRLNLICCTDPSYFKVWKEGTLALKEKAPVTRDFAVEFFRKLREAAGLLGKEHTGDDPCQLPG